VFFVDIIVEVVGKSKGFSQVTDVEQSFVAVDGIEKESDIKIPF